MYIRSGVVPEGGMAPDNHIAARIRAHFTDRLAPILLAVVVAHRLERLVAFYVLEGSERHATPASLPGLEACRSLKLGSLYYESSLMETNSLEHIAVFEHS